MISLQDSILVTFLNLAGFDILFFVPTGYYSAESAGSKAAGRSLYGLRNTVLHIQLPAAQRRTGI